MVNAIKTHTVHPSLSTTGDIVAINNTSSNPSDMATMGGNHGWENCSPTKFVTGLSMMNDALGHRILRIRCSNL